jgi:hypothetical protein
LDSAQRSARDNGEGDGLKFAARKRPFV